MKRGLEIWADLILGACHGLNQRVHCLQPELVRAEIVSLCVLTGHEAYVRRAPLRKGDGREVLGVTKGYWAGAQAT